MEKQVAQTIGLSGQPGANPLRPATSVVPLLRLRRPSASPTSSYRQSSEIQDILNTAELTFTSLAITSCMHPSPCSQL